MEALVLTTAAGAVALLIVWHGVGWGMKIFWEVQEIRPPFWIDTSLSPGAILYIGILSIVGAAIIGILPALRATRRRVAPSVTRLTSGSSPVRFGKMATGVIVLQVAISVIFLPIFIKYGQQILGDRLAARDFPADRYISGRFTWPAQSSSDDMLVDPSRERLALPAAMLADLTQRVRRNQGSPE
jgi:hypothetical protein